MWTTIEHNDNHQFDGLDVNILSETSYADPER